MKKKLFEDKMSLIKRAGAVAMAVIIAGTGFVAWQGGGLSTYNGEEIPELVSFTDPEDAAEVEEDSVPLASSPKVTTKTTTKNTTKKVKMKTKAKKSGTTTKKNTKKNSKTKTSSTKKVKTDTTVVTTTKTTTKKNSKIKTVKTKVVTTVKTTTTALKTTSTSASKTSTTKTSTSSTSGSSSTAAAVSFSYDTSSSSASTSSSSTTTSTVSVRSLATKADSRVLSAFEKMYGKVKINGGVSYSGCFDANTMTITLKESGSTIYHELGHFVDFVGGTNVVDQQITAAYNAEKSKYNSYNKSYVLQNSAEYFAESFKNYCENPASLKSSRPKTYAAIVAALDNMTTTRINTLLSVYGSMWNK